MGKTDDNFDGGKPNYSRTGARDAAFKLIFQAQEQGDDLYALLDEELLNPYKAQDSSYLRTVVVGTISEMDSIDEVIEAKSKGWKKDRISKVCIAVLRLALYEMLHMEDIPESVAINEAVDLAKKYEGPDAGSFVNGILGSAQEDVPQPEEATDGEVE